MTAPKPCCFDCLTGDVSVRVTDELGFDHWFCAADWDAEQEFGARIAELLRTAVAALDERDG